MVEGGWLVSERQVELEARYNFIKQIAEKLGKRELDRPRGEILLKLQALLQGVNNPEYLTAIGRLAQDEYRRYREMLDAMIGMMMQGSYEPMPRFNVLNVDPTPRFEAVDGTNEIKASETPAIQVFIEFYKSQRKLHVTVLREQMNGNMTTIYNASNRVLNDGPEERTTTPYPRGSNNQTVNYYPKSFPDGSWEVDNGRQGNNGWEGKYVLQTNAHQLVEGFRPGNPINEEDEWVHTEMVEDGGYNIHAGDNNWQTNTQGCIKVEASTMDILWKLYKEVKKDKKNGARMLLNVIGE
jgi:hypothetical protein